MKRSNREPAVLPVWGSSPDRCLPGGAAPAPAARALVAAALLLGAMLGQCRVQAAVGLDPTTIPRYVAPLVVPPAMPRVAELREKGKRIDYYEISVREFPQQILPRPLPPTTVWGYGSDRFAGTFEYPSYTIEARANKPVRVKWINGLVDRNGTALPHLLPVDQTLHWANPAGGQDGRDTRPVFTETPGPYTGPVPMVTHLHGAHCQDHSDGYSEAWYLPACPVPPGYATTGLWYDAFRAKSPLGSLWEPGSAVYEYPNDQAAAALWYHDHTLGMTRVNVYGGSAGFYLLRGGCFDLPAGVLPGPAPAIGDKPNKKHYEIPIMVQDRSFLADGGLFYPGSREFFDGFTGLFVPHTDVSPIWNPEFFGDTIVANGRTWPELQVEQRRYRFRLLNACGSRFLILKMAVGDPESPEARTEPAALPFHQIGADGGFLPGVVTQDELLMGPSERADVVVDFTQVPVGTAVYVLNLGPDEPYGGGVPGPDPEISGDFPWANPATTGQVMKLTVVPRTSVDRSLPVSALRRLPVEPPVYGASFIRRVSLNEMMSMVWDGPAMAMLGTMDADGNPVPQGWENEPTETPTAGAPEIWEIYNYTADAHPIHLHQVEFKVLSRQFPGGPVLPPEPWERGRKDTVIAYPGDEVHPAITRVKARFDLPGLFMWHCHIMEHEDNEMMRPLEVKPPK